ncbi:hypothetical protein PHMEG_00023027 [Phytophthora megakarya]|uniref:Uncharacterized protein n=1 Tax=Phytophthora megakarya TaxID=4795 RepID=A0A225VHU4_9STRA|nr:hypothetical protein PHMEG_00023027 [Phytophthora megakarya]
MRNFDLQMVVLSDRDGYIRMQLTPTIQRGYLESLYPSFNEAALPQLKAHYGQSNAQGMAAALIAELYKALGMRFSSVGQLIALAGESGGGNDHSEPVRSDENSVAVSQSVFGKQCSEGFRLEKVEVLQRNSFIAKRKNHIQATQDRFVSANYVASHRPLGKRKWEDDPKKKGSVCFYCASWYYRDGETQRKAAFPKMKTYRSIGLVRISIFVKGDRVEVPSNSVEFSQMNAKKKNSKNMAKPIREEIPAEV